MTTRRVSAVDVLFGEVDVALGCGVDDVNVDALAGARTNIGHDNDKGVADMKCCCRVHYDVNLEYAKMPNAR